jgi:hypothetical protein
LRAPLDHHPTRIETMDADLHAVLGISKLSKSMRTRSLIEGVLTGTFVSQHPTLVRMLQSPELDPAIVECLVDRLKCVREGHQDLHDASVAVGQTLVDAYVRRGSFPEGVQPGRDQDQST